MARVLCKRVQTNKDNITVAITVAIFHVELFCINANNLCKLYLCQICISYIEYF